MSLKQIDGLPVYDAKHKLTVTVNPTDIASADRKDPNHCAFAEACRRELHVKEVRVHLGRIYTRSNDKNWQRYITPKYLRTEIIAFDRGGQFSVGNFVISPPPPTKKASGARQGSKMLSMKGKRHLRKEGTRRKPHIITDVRTSITRGPGRS